MPALVVAQQIGDGVCDLVDAVAVDVQLSLAVADGLHHTTGLAADDGLAAGIDLQKDQAETPVSWFANSRLGITNRSES